jgi:iron complex outermembrane receptor protein
MHYRFSFLCVSAFLFFAGFSPLVFSQETISVDVNVERITEEVPTVSSTTTVISSDEITESGASSIVEILENVPGIMFRSALAGPGSEQITMRGFGENSHGRVLVLIDGNRMNNPDMSNINWNAVSLLDIERIEILDGASSVRYGNNAVAGVVNIITKKSGKTQTSINLSGGSFWNNKEGISHQQSTDWGRFSLSAEHIGSDGYRKRSANDITNAALQGTIDLSDQLSLTLKGSFSSINYEMPGAIFETDYKNDPQTALNWYDEAREHHISSGAELEWILSDNIEVNLPILYRGLFTQTDTDTYLFSSYTNRNTNSAEAHPTANFNFEINDMRLDVSTGMDFHFANLLAKTYSSIDRKNSPSELEINTFDSGYFLTARFNPIDRLTFNLGSRYNFIVLDSKDENTFKQAFVYEAGAAYKPIEPLNIYAKYSTLFRFPFTDEMVETYPSFYINDDLKPEQGFNAEGGINFNFTKWLSLDANLYYMKLNDEIAYNTSITPSHNQNLDGTQRIGTNIHLLSKPVDFLELQGSYSYVKAEFIDGTKKGKIIPLVPAHEISSAVTFILPWNIKIGVDMDYRGTAFQGSDFSNNQKKIDDYFLLGTSISYTLDKNNNHLMILFQGNNLFNVTYSPYVTPGLTPTWSTESAYYPGNGREFNLSINYRF